MCVCVCVRVRVRVCERERQTDRQTDRHRQTDRQSETDKQTERSCILHGEVAKLKPLRDGDIAYQTAVKLSPKCDRIIKGQHDIKTGR